MDRRVRSPSVLAALATFAALFAAACADRPPATPLSPDAGPSLGVGKAPPASSPARYLVGFTSAQPAIPSGALAASGGTVVDAIPALKVLVVDNVTNPAALKQVAGVKYVEAGFETQVDPQRFVDPLIGPHAEPDPSAAPFYQSRVQWDIRAMHADEAWAAGFTGTGATVCIVDSGVDDQHQELSGKVLLRANFVTTAGQNGPTQVNDGNGHGSHVAGEAAGRGVVTSGVAPGASVLGARVLNNAGSGSDVAIVRGIQWCADNGAHAINVSIGGIVYRGQSDFTTSVQTYTAAVEYARTRGAVVVISAGNENLQIPNPGNAQRVIPAIVASAITVGATGPTSKVPQSAAPNWDPFTASQVWAGVDTKAYYSNWGIGVDVFAPGGRGGLPLSVPYLYVYVNGVGTFQGGPYDNVWGVCASTTTQNGALNVGGAPGSIGSCSGQTNRYASYAGTSMAAPHVTGLAALLYARLGGAPSVAKRDRVEACLLNNADAIGPASTFGRGRVNAKRALDAMTAGTC